MDITALAQFSIASALKEGDLAIDATVGNGYDTVFLARCVGPSGVVIGFDVQTIALAAATEKLAGEEGLTNRVALIRGSHASLRTVLLERQEQRRPRAIMFNLGYLPGGDKAITTMAEETLSALAVSTELLAPGGVLTIVLYPGHSEGKREAAAVLKWAKTLGGIFTVILSRPLNRTGMAPRLVVVERSI